MGQAISARWRSYPVICTSYSKPRTPGSTKRGWPTRLDLTEPPSLGGKTELQSSGTMRVDGGESVCKGPGNGRRVEILLKTKVVFGKDVVGSSKIKSGGGGGGGTGKERNEKSQAALASGRFGGSSDLIDTWLTPAHPPSFGERRPLISPGEVDILLSNTLFKLLSTFCLSLLHLGMYLNERHRSYDYPQRQLDAVLWCHPCHGWLTSPPPGMSLGKR